MIDLRIFFNHIEAALLAEAEKDIASLYHQIQWYQKDFPNWEKADIALVGLMEEQGTKQNIGVAGAADAFRKHFYKLKKSRVPYNVVDLGNLRNAPSLQETYQRIKVVAEILMRQHIIPVFIGGSQDLMVGQFWAYQGLDQVISIANIDAIVDVDESQEEENKKHLLQILTHQPNYLFNFSQIGHQAYLSSLGFLDIFEKMYFDVCSVGRIREDILNIEPIIRDADMVAFDMMAIRKADAGATAYAQPFGLTSDEAAQLAWYAGISPKSSSIGFYEYNPTLDTQEGHTAQVLSVMVWYFIEGFYHRRKETNFNSKAFTKYIIPFSEHTTQEMIFYKQVASNQWWVEVPYNQIRSNPVIIACSYQDYLLATEGIIPDRWLNTHAKLP
ncbi:MAG: formimidoylglutamase [Thermonemataceae bacterium]|nr:formimidoylglutamase [Thermonemataceae bacterium]